GAVGVGMQAPVVSGGRGLGGGDLGVGGGPIFGVADLDAQLDGRGGRVGLGSRRDVDPAGHVGDEPADGLAPGALEVALGGVPAPQAPAPEGPDHEGPDPSPADPPAPPAPP